MMKKIFVVLLLLVSGYVMAQPSNYVPYQSRNRYIALMADSTFHIPRFNGSPSLRTGGSSQDGALAADTANGRLYMYYNGSWGLVNKDTANTFLNSLYKKTGTDSIFQIKGGTHSFVFTVGSGSGSSSDSSTLFVDTTYNRLAHQISTDSLMLKSARIQLNGSDVTPTVTDSTISWNIVVSGGTGDTAYYDPNPSHWYHTKSTNNPTFARVTASESTTYVPSGFQGPDGRWWAFVKGDLYNRIYKYYSNDNGKNWTYDGIAVKPRNTHQDSTYNLEPYAHLVGDSVYLYYMGGGSYPLPNFGIWLATCHYDSLYGNAEPFVKGSTPMLSNAQFQSLIGVGYQVGYIGLSSIVKKDGQYYFHGGWLNGNVSVNPVLRTRLWVGVASDYRNITSIDSIPIPLDSIQVGVKAPSVWKENDYYKMIFSKGDPYYNGGYLMSAYSSDLINWTQYADSFAFPTADTSWEGKQIYSGQLMKVQSDNYDQPLLVNEDTVYGGPQPYSYGYYTYLFSASYDSIYFVDQAGLMRIYPQKSTPLFATDDNGKHPHSVQRNTTTVLNIPKSGMAKNGYLDSLDYRRFYYKADSSGQWSYIQNRTTQQTDANFYIGGYGYTRKFNAGGSFPDAGSFALTADGYQISGNAFQLRNASNYGILRNFIINSEVNDYWYGSGQGFVYQYTGSNAINWQAYKYNFRSFFSPLAPMLTMYGRSDHDTVIEMNTTRGVSYPHTDAGITQFVGHTDYYNTTSSALNSYAVEAKNTATRSSGSNNLTNYGGRFSASGGQANYSLSLGNPAQYEANYGSSFTDRSLVDKKYVDSVAATVGGSSLTIDSLTYNSSTSRLTLNVTGQSDVDVTLPNSYLVNPIHPDSILAQKNDTVMVAKAVTVESQLPDIAINTVRTDTTLKHQLVKLNISEPIISFTAGAGFAADTTVFTDSTIYGSFYTGQDSFYVTKAFAVLKGQSGDTLGIQVVYNDTFNVTGTVVGGGTLAVNNRTTGNSFDISTNSGIPPNMWVWLKSPTVVAGKKPEYLSVTLIGYRRYVAP